MPTKKQKHLSQRVMDELMEGMNDTVLAVVRVGWQVFAHLHPDSEIQIAPTWFVEMLNSVSWSDRSKAVAALVIQKLHQRQAVDVRNQYEFERVRRAAHGAHHLGQGAHGPWLVRQK